MGLKTISLYDKLLVNFIAILHRCRTFGDTAKYVAKLATQLAPPMVHALPMVHAPPMMHAPPIGHVWQFHDRQNSLTKQIP